MQDAGTWPASMSQEQLHQCLAAAIAACGLRRQRPTLWSTPVGCLMAADLIAWAAGRMRQSSPNQKAHGATDLRLVDFASSINLVGLADRPLAEVTTDRHRLGRECKTQ